MIFFRRPEGKKSHSVRPNKHDLKQTQAFPTQKQTSPAVGKALCKVFGSPLSASPTSRTRKHRWAHIPWAQRSPHKTRKKTWGPCGNPCKMFWTILYGCEGQILTKVCSILVVRQIHLGGRTDRFSRWTNDRPSSQSCMLIPSHQTFVKIIPKKIQQRKIFPLVQVADSKRAPLPQALGQTQHGLGIGISPLVALTEPMVNRFIQQFKTAKAPETGKHSSFWCKKIVSDSVDQHIEKKTKYDKKMSSTRKNHD